MDAKQKIILACLVGLLCAGVAWYLFSVPSTGPTDSYRVEDGFDRTAREQQTAAAVASGRELTRRSVEILGRYQGGVPEERESPREDRAGVEE